MQYREPIYNEEYDFYICPYNEGFCACNTGQDCTGYECSGEDRSKVFPPIPKHIQQWKNKLK